MNQADAMEVSNGRSHRLSKGMRVYVCPLVSQYTEYVVRIQVRRWQILSTAHVRVLISLYTISWTILPIRRRAKAKYRSLKLFPGFAVMIWQSRRKTVAIHRLWQIHRQQAGAPVASNRCGERESVCVWWEKHEASQPYLQLGLQTDDR